MIKKISRLIGIVIIILILRKLDFSEIKEIILGTNKYYLVLGLSLTLVGAFIKSVRWNYLKRIQNINYSIKDSFIMYCTGILLGIITPGRLGELAKIFYIKKDGYSYGKSALSIIFDRIFDIVFLVIFSVLGMLFFINFFEKGIILVVISIPLILIILYFIIQNNLIKNAFSKIFRFLIPIKYQKSWQINAQDFINDWKKFKKQNYISIITITSLAWLIYYCQMFILSKSLNINIPFFYLAVSVTIAGIVSMIPISYSGIGTRDLILISFFSVVFISQEMAVAFSSLILLTHLIMVIVGFFCWLKKPISFDKNK